MRSSGSQDAASHRGGAARVADSRSTATASTNFEYDDNEWDIGIGNLIIDLDADIEKTNEGGSSSNMAVNAGPNASAKAAAKMAVEHSATVQEKGLKMKIKRTKTGTKASEAKHEIVKSNEQQQQNGNVGTATGTAVGSDGHLDGPMKGGKHAVGGNTGNMPLGQGLPHQQNASSTNSSSSSGGNSKRSSGGHRRDKTRDKHSDKPAPTGNISGGSKSVTTVPVSVPEVNGIVRVSATQLGPQRPVFPASTGPGPPVSQACPLSGPPASPAAATAPGSAAKPEQAKVMCGVLQPSQNSDDRSMTPPPSKKIKTDPKVRISTLCTVIQFETTHEQVENYPLRFSFQLRVIEI